MQEIGGIATIKSFVEVWGERIAALPSRTATILIRKTTDDLIESLTIGCSDILHITNILQTTFYLKGGCTCLNKFQQMVALVHVLQGEQISVMLHFHTLCIQQRELHPTELGTLPTIGATTKTTLGSIAKT